MSINQIQDNPLNFFKMPYYIAHIIIALIISGVSYFIPDAWIFMGAVFYISREYAQYEIKEFIDWKGLLPVPVLTIIYILWM